MAAKERGKPFPFLANRFTYILASSIHNPFLIAEETRQQ